MRQRALQKPSSLPCLHNSNSRYIVWTSKPLRSLRRAYGVPSDPQKVSRIRAINRAFAALDRDTEGGVVAALAADAVLRNATRFALKLTEHTCVCRLLNCLARMQNSTAEDTRWNTGGVRM